MTPVTIIKIPGCPYCAKAYRAVEELQKEERYAQIPVVRVDETLEPDKVKPYAGQYYYVPTLFVGGKKIFEAHPGDTYETIRAAVEQALTEALK